MTTSRWIVLAASMLLLDASLTFHNVWPTPAVGWAGELSLELAVYIVGLVVWSRSLGPVSRAARQWSAGIWLLLVVGRYAHVTAPALWGRELNFYWDLRFLPDVASMLARAAPPWLSVGLVGAIILAVLTAYLLLRRALDVVCDAAMEPGPRRVLSAASAVLVALFAVELAEGRRAAPLFPTPVTHAYARQAAFVYRAIRGSKSLGPSPSFEGDLSAIEGADVLLFFIESYGAVAFERPAFTERLTVPRAAFDEAIREGGLSVVSAFVESPTFGGSSWFAHITLLSGLDVGDPDTNALLMTERRETMAKAFATRGYRTVAALPGIWHPWPEGAFYGFQEIYTGPRLEYQGPPFGWWGLPDQFTLAKLDQLEIDRPDRPPLFVFFPTLSTHTPFVPTPPYQPDWARMLAEHPYERGDRDRAYAMQPDWLNLAPSYLDAVSYAYEMLAGYLRQHKGRDFVLVLLGDHQPPALVSGEGAPWDVPVHVITNRRQILERLRAHGFTEGLTPSRPGLGKMSGLTPRLLDAFSTPPGVR